MDLATISNDSFVTEMDLIQNAIDSSRTSLMVKSLPEKSQKRCLLTKIPKDFSFLVKYFSRVWIKVNLAKANFEKQFRRLG
jgi:hypothetical protein